MNEDHLMLPMHLLHKYFSQIETELPLNILDICLRSHFGTVLMHFLAQFDQQRQNHSWKHSIRGTIHLFKITLPWYFNRNTISLYWIHLKWNNRCLLVLGIMMHTWQIETLKHLCRSFNYANRDRGMKTCVNQSKCEFLRNRHGFCCRLSSIVVAK